MRVKGFTFAAFNHFMRATYLTSLKNILLLFVCVLCAGQGWTQSRTQFRIEHEQYLKALGNAKDSLYQQILTRYDNFIKLNPANAKAQLERCRFIQNAYYDSYEEYNPHEEETNACARDILKLFPANPEVLLFPSELIWGDTLKTYLIHLEGLATNDTTNWKPFAWKIYEKLAYQYSYDDEDSESKDKTIMYGGRAMAENDTLDLSLTVARAYQAQNNKQQAINIVIEHLDSTEQAWTLSSKAQLLLELGETQRALEVFKISARKDSVNENASGIAKAMIENGLIEDARDYLLKDLHSGGNWNREVKLHALLKYDIRYGSADSAQYSYRRFIEKNFFNDPVGWYRIQLIAKAPLMGWTFGDIARVLMLFAAIAIALIIPYLWILPIHYIGNYLRQKEKITDDATFRWRLKHLWIVSTLWFICNVLTMIFFNYPGLISYFNENLAEDFPLISKQHASLSIFFTLASMVFTMAMLKWEEIKSFFPKLKNNARLVWMGIGLSFALRFGFGIYYVILKSFGVDLNEPITGSASVNDSIISINQFYHPLLGLILTAVIVPIYEEVLFRGIFLSACQRNMKFIFANILQALVFASLHDDWRLLPFYIALAMVAGHYTRKTESLITGVSLHMTNNLFAFLGVLAKGV